MSGERGMFAQATDLITHCTSEFAAYDLEERRDQAREIMDRLSISHSREDMQLMVAAWTKLLLAMSFASKFDQRLAGTGYTPLRTNPYDLV